MPFPANYGGVIDVFYKLVALKKQGVKVVLHCFAYGREPSRELEHLCEKVHYYKRKTGLAANFSFLPYTVRSRQSLELENNLLADNHPILFEVLTTCYLLNDPRFRERRKIYRHSNIEHDYYAELARSEKSFLKKTFLRVEAWKLKRFEKILHHADAILAVNQKDADYFRKKFPGVETQYVPSFHPNEESYIKHGKGSYLLFHGNLSVSENQEGAVWLIENVFSKMDYPCVIAGLNPPDFLKKLTKKSDHIQLCPNPSEAKMADLVRNAQAHVLYTAQPTGLKLKLLNVLFNGRFVICNSNMLSGTGLQQNHSLIVAGRAAEFIRSIDEIINTDFTDELIHERKTLVKGFDNAVNGKKLVETAFRSK